MSKFILIIIFLQFLFINPIFAGTVLKIKGKKVKIKMTRKEFKKGDRVVILDDDGEEVGKARVYKARKKRAYLKMLSGDVEKGYEVAESSMSSSSGGSSKGAVKGYLGLAMVDGLDSSPFVFAGDYEFSKDTLSGFLDDWILQAGFMYWGESIGALSFSILELSGGIEKPFLQMNKLSINGGARFGYARTTVTTSVAFFGTSEVSDGGLFISPQVNAMYAISNKLSFGGELRIPLYLDDNYDFFDIFYLLGSVKYSF